MAMIHINRSGTSLGVFSEEDVREGLGTGRFIGTDLGWREGMASWQPLSQFPEFGAAVPGAGTPPVTSALPTIVPSPAGLTPETVAARQGLPWDERQQRGLFNAFIETLQMVLSRPAEAFTAMKREGGFGEPLIYVLIGGSFGLVFYLIYNFALRSFGIFATRNDPLLHLVGAGMGWIVLVILIPVFITVGAFIHAAILHICLMLVGGAKQSFETTFRVVCFEAGSVSPLMVIPVCGSLIAGIWGIVLRCIGLARAHETDTGRAVLAVLLPLIVCCGGGILLAVLFGLGLSALSQNWSP